jgi:hypothetical protein
MSTNSPSLLNFKDYKLLRENGIAPVCGVPLYLVSGASPPYAMNAININAAKAQQDQPIVLWPLASGESIWNSTWQLTPEGYIVCPYVPDMVIGISNDTTLCTVQRNNSDNTQKWVITWYQDESSGTSILGYTITNPETGLSINAVSQCSSVGYGHHGNISLVNLNGAAPVSEQLWLVLPVKPIPPNSFYIRSGMSGTMGQSDAIVVVTSQTNSDNLICSPWIPGNANQLWRFNADGTISQANDPYESAVLTSTSTSSKDSSGLVTLSPVNGAPTDFQIWTYDHATSFLTVNLQNIGVIGLNVAYKNISNPLITYATGGSNSEWEVFPEQSTEPGQWFYIQTELNQDPSNPPAPDYVLTVASANPEASTLVQINQLQAGALTQLWQLTPAGNLVNALNPSLFLSADATAGDSITLQSPGESGWGQYWCLVTMGLLATTTGTVPQFLCVANSVQTNAMTNGEVSTNTMINLSNDFKNSAWANKPNVIWKIQSYEPDLSGQWFTIQTATENAKDDTPYLLTAINDWKRIQTKPPLGGNIVPGGTAAVNQLWRITMDGIIVSALNPGLYLTAASDNGVTLAAGQTGNANQQWTWGQTWPWIGYPIIKYSILCGQLINSGKQLALYAQVAASNANVALQAAASNGAGTPDQGWIFVPHRPAYNQPTTIRNLGNKGQYPNLYLSLENTTTTNADTITYSYAVSVGPRSENAAFSTWQFIYPGYIVSAVNNEIVLCLEAIEGSDPSNPVYGPYVTTLLRSPVEQSFQLWECSPEGMLISKLTGNVLVVLVGRVGNQESIILTTQPISDGRDRLIYWDFTTGLALQTTLVMPAMPFPSNDDDENVYGEICANLGLPEGLREQYQNLAAPLNSYQVAINMMLLKNEASERWHQVVGQLNEEIMKVTAIQQFFTQAGGFHQALSQAQAMAVAEMITACAFPNGTKVTPPKKKRPWIADIVEGVLYTSLNLFASIAGVQKEAKLVSKSLAVGLPFLANIMSAGLTSYQAINGSQSNSKTQAALQNIYNYELSVFELQQSLLDMFDTIGTTLGEMEMVILADWGKISAVYDMIKTKDSIDSLYWPASMTPVMTKQMLGGYATKVLQTLIPSNASFYINGYLHNAQGKGLQQDQVTFYGENPDGTYSQWVAVINAEVMNLVWTYGTNPSDFYRQSNGWNIQVKYPFNPTESTDTPSNATLVITFFNMTTVPMLLETGGMTYVMKTGNLELPPHGAQQIAGYVYYNYAFEANTSAYGDFSVVEKDSGDPILNGNLAYMEINNKNPENPGVKLTPNPMTINAPYYLIKQTQNPLYIANMLSIEIFIGADRGNSNS